MAKRTWTKRVIDNSFGGGSLGTVAYAPVIGRSHTKQDLDALFSQYRSAYEEAKIFVGAVCNDYGGKLPDVYKAQRESAEWYAGMISKANTEMGEVACENKRRLCRDAICALYAEAVALGAAKPLLKEGVKYCEWKANCKAATDKQNRPSAAEAEERLEEIRVAAIAAFPDPRSPREEVITFLCKPSKQGGKVWKRWMIEKAIRGMYGQRAKSR